MLQTPAEAGLFYRGPYKINAENAGRKAAKVYLPNNYSSKKKWPLVLLLHGTPATGDLQNIFFRLSLHVSKKQFILLLPEGTKDHKGHQFWNATDSCCDYDRSHVDDEGYLLNLIKEVSKHYAVDESRISVFGHSNGGFMAHRLACNASHVFSGIASLAGALYKDESLCNPTDPISILEIHAKDDKDVPFNGGIDPDSGVAFPGALDTIHQWVSKNNCHENSYQDSGPYNLIWSIPARDTSVRAWKDCAKNAEVDLWTIRSWPLHYAHAPWVSARFVDMVLDFLFNHPKNLDEGSHN